jgi:cytochrome P450
VSHTTLDDPRSAGLLPLESHEFRIDPYPFYARLRREARTYETPIGMAISRHEDAYHVLTSREYVKLGEVPAWAKGSPQTARFLSLDMAFQSREEHQRIRRAVNRHFTPKAITYLRQRMEEIISADLETIVGERTFEVVADFACRFPVTVAAETLGIPKADHEQLYRACRGTGSFTEPAPTAEVIATMEKAFEVMLCYCADLVADRRAHPRENDLLTVLVNAESAEKQLSDDELAALACALFIGGFQTTCGTVCNGIRGLAEFPDQLDMLRSRPELSTNATEEILRWDAVGQFKPRRALAEVTLAGEKFSAGTPFLVIIGAANRDPDRHAKPDELRLERVHDQRSHFTFGGGPYYCLGHALARMELEIVWRLFPAHFERLEVTDIEYETGPSIRAPLRMEVSAVPV